MDNKSEMFLYYNKLNKVNKCQRIPKGQSKKETPEKLAIQGTQDEEKQNKNTEKLAIQGTQDEEKQNTTQRNWQYRVHKMKKNKTQHRETGNIGYTR